MKMFEVIKLKSSSLQARKLLCRQALKTSNVIKSFKIFIFLAQNTVFCDVKCSSTSSKSGLPVAQASARSVRSEI